MDIVTRDGGVLVYNVDLATDNFEFTHAAGIEVYTHYQIPPSKTQLIEIYIRRNDGEKVKVLTCVLPDKSAIVEDYNTAIGRIETACDYSFGCWEMKNTTYREASV